MSLWLNLHLEIKDYHMVWIAETAGREELQLISAWLWQNMIEKLSGGEERTNKQGYTVKVTYNLLIAVFDCSLTELFGGSVAALVSFWFYLSSLQQLLLFWA